MRPGGLSARGVLRSPNPDARLRESETLEPDIPESGPRLTPHVSTWEPLTDPLHWKPADVDVAGFFVGGPEAPLPGWPESLTGSDHAKQDKPPARTQAERREERNGKKSLKRAAANAAFAEAMAGHNARLEAMWRDGTGPESPVDPEWAMAYEAKRQQRFAAVRQAE